MLLIHRLETRLERKAEPFRKLVTPELKNLLTGVAERQRLANTGDLAVGTCRAVDACAQVYRSAYAILLEYTDKHQHLCCRSAPGQA